MDTRGIYLILGVQRRRLIGFVRTNASSSWCACGTKPQIFEVSGRLLISRPLWFYQGHLGRETGLLPARFRFRKRRTRIRSQWFPIVDRRRLKCRVIYSGGSTPLDKGGWGGGGSHPDSEIREGDRSQKQFFSAHWASFWSKNKGEGRAPRPPPLDSPLIYSHDCSKLNKTNMLSAKISIGFLTHSLLEILPKNAFWS